MSQTFGLIIVGDEILSGRRADKHLSKVIELLNARGLHLSWVEYVGDERQRLTATYARSFASHDIVFSCGGIGATPDDHTRQCVAAALGVPLVLHPEAAALIAERCAVLAAEGKGSADMQHPENLQRLKMGEFPQGARIIPNPFNQIPGFAIHQHYFVPGFPQMAWPMIASILDHDYASHHHQTAWLEKSLHVFDMPESRLTPLMENIEKDFSGVKVFSLPTITEGNARRYIELGVKGDPEKVEQAFQVMQAGLQQLNVEFSNQINP